MAFHSQSSLDGTDWQILRELQQDARLSFNELALQRRFALLRRFEYYYDMSRRALKFPSYTPWRILPEGDCHEKDYSKCSLSIAFDPSATSEWTATKTGHSSKHDDCDPRVDRLPSSV